MQFSIWESSAHSWADIAAVARIADAGGWNGLWVPDHYMPNTMEQYAGLGVDELIVPARGLSRDPTLRIEQYAELWEVAARPQLG